MKLQTVHEIFENFKHSSANTVIGGSTVYSLFTNTLYGKMSKMAVIEINHQFIEKSNC